MDAYVSTCLLGSRPTTPLPTALPLGSAQVWSHLPNLPRGRNWSQELEMKTLAHLSTETHKTNSSVSSLAAIEEFCFGSPSFLASIMVSGGENSRHWGGDCDQTSGGRGMYLLFLCFGKRKEFSKFTFILDFNITKIIVL